MMTSPIFMWWLFCSKIYWKTICMSPHRINQNILTSGCLLDLWLVLWYQYRLELIPENKCWPLHAKLYTQCHPWVPTPISKNIPTCTMQIVTPKLWSKNTMGQRVKFIRDNTKTEKKTNPKSGGSILWTDSQPNVTSGTWINRSRSIKTNNTNRVCRTPIFRLLCKPLK